MDAIPFQEGSLEEVRHLLRAYVHSDGPTSSNAQEVEFHVSACRQIRLHEHLITPGNRVTNSVVMLAGYPMGIRRHHRLYLVEPDEVAMFPKWLKHEPGGFLTPLVHVKLHPQITMTHIGEAPPLVRIMVGRLPDLEHLVCVLGLRSL